MKSTNLVSSQLSFPGFLEPPLPDAVAREKLPTNTTADRHAVHRWFNFIAGFAPEFVAQQCQDLVNGVLLDPFAGCGTSLVVAQNLGHRALGYEAHPFFVRIARAKTATPPAESQLKAIETVLLSGIQAPKQASLLLSGPAEMFLTKLFEERTLQQLLGARVALEGAGMEADDLAFLVLSRALDMCSMAQTDGIYKAPASAKKADLPILAIRKIVSDIRHDSTLATGTGKLPEVILYPASSEDMNAVKTGSIDVVVTSPPYLNNFDFAEMTRMYLYFWGTCSSWRDISTVVRSKLIINTTTALSGQRELQSQYRNGIVAPLLPDLDKIVSALAVQRRDRPGKKEYDLLVYPYFSQMTRVLLEVQRSLATGGYAHVVVADAAFYGIHVSTPQFLASTMSEIGFQNVQCTKLRDRGHRWILSKRAGSPIGLGEYHVSAKQERPS